MTLSLFPERVEPTAGEDVAYTPLSRAAAIVRSLLPDLGANPLVCDPHAGGGAFCVRAMGLVHIDGAPGAHQCQCHQAAHQARTQHGCVAKGHRSGHR